MDPAGPPAADPLQAALLRAIFMQTAGDEARLKQWYEAASYYRVKIVSDGV